MGVAYLDQWTIIVTPTAGTASGNIEMDGIAGDGVVDLAGNVASSLNITSLSAGTQAGC